MQGALSRLLAGKTVLVIAHRMRTVEAADKIVVLSDGMVAEDGSPAELLANENGVLMDLPLNVSVEGTTFCGTIVFVGFDGEEFTDCPLTKADLLEVIGE